MPRWGPHTCANDDDTRLVRHTAGQLVSYLHFYRVPAAIQVRALIEALAFVCGDGIHPARLDGTMQRLMPDVWRLARGMRRRVQRGTQAQNLVMDVHRPRLAIKVKK
jgi:hypothetical protein